MDGEKNAFHTRSVNTGVHSGFLCGANLRPWYKRTFLDDTSKSGLAMAAHKDMTLAAWRGSGSHNLNVARVITTNMLKIDGVENLWFKVTLPEESDNAPAIASHGGRVFVTWTGTDDKLNLIFSDDDGVTFTGKIRFDDTSDQSPALVSHGGKLFLDWKGEGAGTLNVAEITLVGGIPAMGHKATLGCHPRLLRGGSARPVAAEPCRHPRADPGGCRARRLEPTL